MPFEDKPLREVTEADIRNLVDSGMQEHMLLEYKSALYPGTDAGRREFLLDCCMFANTDGGLLLIGIHERRKNGQPTGAPDPEAQLGITVANPEATLQALDASFVATTEERLKLESAAIRIGNDRHVLAFRVPNSIRKPHGVRFQGHVYFPARRERSRYELSVSEIKEMTTRAEVRLNEAERSLTTLLKPPARANDLPLITSAMIPVFTRPFQVTLRDPGLIRQFGSFHITGRDFADPEHSFNGLVRKDDNHHSTARFSHDRGLSLVKDIPYRVHNGIYLVNPIAFDLHIHSFVRQAGTMYAAANVEPPFILGIGISLEQELRAEYPGVGGFAEPGGALPRQDYKFPFLQLLSFEGYAERIRPLCDLVHQSFNRDRSPCFDAAGAWIGNPFEKAR